MANIGVPQEQRQEIVKHLNTILADEYALFTKLFKYHWNVTGMSFGSLHQLFEEQYEKTFKIIDKVAERVRALGDWPIGTLQEFKQHSNLDETPGRNPDAQTMISDLVADHETIIQDMRKKVELINKHEDSVTANFVEELIEKHEKKAWMLRSHLV